MEIEVYQVDAFADELFKGNPAMVCPLQEWIDEGLMQKIAFENNLSETCFYVPASEGFEIRWFTPKKEVNLCGHATLAAALVARERGEMDSKITFQSKSGPLHVEFQNGEFVLNFPKTEGEAIDVPDWAADLMGLSPVSAVKCDDDYLLVYESSEDVVGLTPDFNGLAKVKARGIIATSRSNEFDFISRFFAPAAGINEDPVTGSAHTKLVPYWSDVLGEYKLRAKQVSERGGVLNCELKGDRVFMSGKGKLFLKGVILIS